MGNPLNLKVGDKVRLDLSGSFEYQNNFNGKDELIVAKIDATDSVCTYALRERDEDDYWWVQNDHILGKVKDAPSSAHTFKVGDKVRVIDHRPSNFTEPPTWCELMDKRTGQIGTVTGKLIGGILTVSFGDGWWNYRPEWLTPVTRRTPNIFDSIGARRDNPIKSNIPLIETDKLLTIKLE